MVVKNMEWYLVAYCEASQGMRVFRCDRLLEAERLPESYVLPEDFSLEQFWRDWVGEFSGIIAAGRPAGTESIE
jgi:predicted DNA-binding transcriptional regulator YafY